MSDILFLSVLDVSVSTGCIIVLLFLFSSFLNKRYSIKWKYMIWIFIALRLIFPFNTESIQYIGNLIHRNADSAQYETAVSEQDRDTAAPRRLVMELPNTISEPLALHDDKINGVTPLDILKIIWMTGCLGFLTIHVGSYLYYKSQLIRTGVPIKNTPNNRYIFKQIAELYTELHIERKYKMRVYRSSVSGSPMIIGFLNPFLILPKIDYEKEELYFILKHELIHLKRHDVCWKFLFVTANALHWFNPLVWFMRREAFLDMELSCDERVVLGEDYNTRKIYAEILYTTLHKKCKRRILMSTQLNENTQIMKKRFHNLLMRVKKRNGAFILLFTIILTVGLSVLIGCSVQKPALDDTLAENESVNVVNENVQSLSNETDASSLNTDNANMQDSNINNSESPIAEENQTLDNTTTLTFFLEGEPEEETAELYVGNGYSIYIPNQSPYPEDENVPVWEQTPTDTWVYAYNNRIRFWIERHESMNIEEMEKELADTQGFIIDNESLSGRLEMAKQDADLLTRVRLMESSDVVWCIFYSYPEEAIEGAGARIPIIIDTFAVTP
ncbi:MAG: M56 family metallopeptidase [Lachnospiraceae bacterium]|nr:M56 family metallopeptidase [Lachnospiraceae bacterium]